MKTKKDKRSNLRKEYDDAIVYLRSINSIHEKEYAEQLKNVERLHKLLMDEECHKNRVSKDAILGALVGLGQVGLILSWEHMHVVTSKAINFVIKGRLR